MDQFDYFNKMFDRAFPPPPELLTTAPNHPEDTRTDEEKRTLVAEYLDTNALDSADCISLKNLSTGEQENECKKFREALANAIDLESAEAFQALGKIVASMGYRTLEGEV